MGQEAGLKKGEEWGGKQDNDDERLRSPSNLRQSSTRKERRRKKCCARVLAPLSGHPGKEEEGEV